MKRAGIIFAVLIVWGIGFTAKHFFGFDEGFIYSLIATFGLGFLWK